MSIFDGNLKIEVASASGIEAVTKRELIKLGYEPSGSNFGRIDFEGTMQDVYRANIFLRTANRVKIVLGEFEAETFDQLFENTQSIDWENILPVDAKIIINAKSLKSTLFALSSIQSIAKKAIISRLSNVYGKKTFAESGATYNIEFSFIEDNVKITLDTSGEGLHKRGYRVYLGDAPIRETLASAMIQLSVWNSDRTFIDPFCGSGTIPIETALIGLNIASGMNRNFICETFPNCPNVRSLVQDEAEQLIDRDKQLRISGFDINPSAIKLAHKHAEKAGVADKIHFQVSDMREIKSRYPYGVIVTNPPYGERLMKESELRVLYRDFGTMYKNLNEWCAYVITSYRGFEKYFGKRANKTRTLYNSELKCGFYQYLGKKPVKQEKK